MVSTYPHSTVYGTRAIVGLLVKFTLQVVCHLGKVILSKSLGGGLLSRWLVLVFEGEQHLGSPDAGMNSY
jgi:hypothetical protein